MGDFLAGRLKKILTDKYVNNSSKGNKNKARDFLTSGEFSFNNNNNLTVNANTKENSDCYYDDCRMITQPAASSRRVIVCRTSNSSRK